MLVIKILRLTPIKVTPVFLDHRYLKTRVQQVTVMVLEKDKLTYFSLIFVCHNANGSRPSLRANGLSARSASSGILCVMLAGKKGYISIVFNAGRQVWDKTLCN